MVQANALSLNLCYALPLMGGRPEDMCAIARTHSDMVKSGPHDDEYRKVRERLI